MNGESVKKEDIENKLKNLNDLETPKMPFTQIFHHRKTCFRTFVLIILS